MRILDLHRTTSFRLSLMFLGLFGLCSLLLFSFVYQQTKSFVRGEQDAWLARESLDFVGVGLTERIARLQAHAASDLDAERPFSEFDDKGHLLAGNLPVLPDRLQHSRGPNNFSADIAGKHGHYRGLMTVVSGGHRLVISRNIGEPNEFQEKLVNAMVAAGLLTLLLGLIGAMVLGTSAVRHIDAITGSIKRIVTGDLSQRLPVKRGADDINRLTIAVNGMLDDIERLMHEVKGVCDGIAHDLRTPLTRILAGLERAQRRATHPVEFGQAIDRAMTDILGLLRTFNAMLRISEIEAGARRSGFQAIDINRLLEDLLEFYQPFAEESGLQLSIEKVHPGQVLILHADPSLLFDALSNLVDNAIKFTPAGGRVCIQSASLDGNCSITVSDSGPGIASEDQIAVLTRFYRSEPSRNKPGNGLGLSLVSVTARMHGMQMQLTNGSPLSGLNVQLSWKHEVDQPPKS